MRVTTLGDESEGAALAAVGAVHGDEPCGARAIERFLSEGPTDRVRRPVKLVVANERALSAGERYVDADLNRSFPGDPDSDDHEERLAHRLRQTVDGCLTLGFHATVSTPEPFGTLADPTPEKAALMRALPVEKAADFTGMNTDGRSVSIPRFVNVEAGYQGSAAAAENAYDCLVAFLRHADALPGDPDGTPTANYRVDSTIEKTPGREYEFRAENFERVAAGDPYAETADGQVLRAQEAFWPVLASGDGHRRLLGYRAERTGTLQ